MKTANEIQSAIDSALIQATDIAFEVAEDPKRYVQPKIKEWGKRYVYSRFYGFDPGGFFDQLEKEWFGDLFRSFPHEPIGVSGLTSDDFTASWTGEARGSAAALGCIDYIKLSRSQLRTEAGLSAYLEAKQMRNAEAAGKVFLNEGRGLLRDFSTLFNTLLLKTAQGAQPKAVPGPGQILVGPDGMQTIVDVSKRPITMLTVEEFEQIVTRIVRG
jgi:hypothetical protein